MRLSRELIFAVRNRIALVYCLKNSETYWVAWGIFSWKEHMPMRRACQITLNDADRTILERWSRGRSTPARLVTRARVVLAAAAGKENKDIAVELHISRGAVARWRDRFAAAGIAGLEKDAPRGGRPPKARQDLVRRIIEMTTQQKPSNATHWSTRNSPKRSAPTAPLSTGSGVPTG